MKKETVLFFSSLGMSILLVIGIGELALRIRYGATSLPWELAGGFPAHLFMPDERTGYTLTPGFHGWQLVPGRPDVELRINRQGLRDYERELPSTAKVIMVLGDSYAFGQGVPFEEIWPILLENKIRAIGPQYCVMKAGVPGFSWRQYYQQYQRLVGPLKEHPLVIVTFTVDGQERLTRKGYAAKGGILVRRTHPHLVVLEGLVYVKLSRHDWINQIDAFLRTRSYFFRWFNQRIGLVYHNFKRSIRQWLKPPLHEERPPRAEKPSPPSQPELPHLGMRQGAMLLNSISELSKTKGAKMLVLFVDYPNDRVEEITFYEKILAQKGILSLDLSKYEGASWESWRLPKDDHFNALGNREIAEIVFQFIREKKLLESVH